MLSQIHHQIYADSDSRLQPITERANQTINHLDSAQGAEIQIGDEEVLIRFTKEALLAAGQGITSGSKRTNLDD
ncbi:MAG: hypothetical protein HO274_04915 [Ferrovum myxofaciens]|uniref:hypothetical protein n=1 Tax=Ferrovum myxofaciens TaxID=416213 RepID=UPI002352568D|nr:hypothetical protein [Ferrovum myxofaciens]QKE40712.1 MAG: hypothetical protein HO274_04915 [Ferrovum myxofaciens]